MRLSNIGAEPQRFVVVEGYMDVVAQRNTTLIWRGRLPSTSTTADHMHISGSQDEQRDLVVTTATGLAVMPPRERASET